MLWICIYLPRLPLEVFTQKKQHGALVVEEKSNHRRQVLLANTKAHEAGINIGSSISTALSLVSTLSIKKKDEAAEWQALEQLATWAYQFTPYITLQEHTLLLEVESSLTLFKGKDALCKHVTDGLQQWGYQYSIACCSTAKSAHLLAKAKVRDKENNNIQKLFFHTDDIQQCPIDLLDINEKTKKSLLSMGLKKIKDITCLPEDAINRRFGTSLSLQLQQVMGKTSDIQKNFSLPRTFDQSIHFTEELTHSSSLLFPLKRLLSYLENYLLARQLLCNSFVVTFNERSQQRHSLVMQLAQPHYRSDYFLSLIKLKLENINLQQPVIGIKVTARYFSPMTQQTRDLFLSYQESAQSKHALIDTLTHRLGERSMHQIVINNDYRPEIAAQTRPIDINLHNISSSNTPSINDPSNNTIKEKKPQYNAKDSHKKRRNPQQDIDATIQTQHPELTRPLWLFQQPQPLHNKKGVPIYGERLQLIKGPERIETGWWDKQPINRDYYVAQHPTGVIYWIYVDRDKSTQELSPYTPKYQDKQWFLHGVFG